MSVETITLGCRLNFAESEAMRARMPANEDWVIVNSCAVTAEAVRQTRQAIRRARREHPNARMVVTGCAAQLEPRAFAAMPEVDLVLGNADKFATRHPGLEPGPAFPGPDKSRRIPGQAREDGKIQVSDLATAPLSVASGFQGHVRSFVAVQTGCDHRCTFCTIWTARGPSRSLPFEAIRDAVAREIDRGALEIVLTGVDITDYQGGLGRLCERLLDAEPRLERLRLSSLDSVEIDEELLELVAGEPRLMPHFHLSLQAGDDLVLKRMKRRHSRADAVRMVERIKAARPDATIGADLIAGFPTETEAMARRSLDLLDDCDVIAAHVFPFSARPGTPAARMPQLDPAIIKARAARLRQAAAARRSVWLDRLAGTTQRVLVENHGKGHSDGFAPVAIAGAERGAIGEALILGRDGDRLVGLFA